MRKKTFLLIMSLFLFFLLVGCNPNNDRATDESPEDETGVKENNSENTEIEIWTFYRGLEPIISRFHMLHPTIKVNVTYFDGIQDYHLKYLEALANNSGPDLFVIDNRHFGTFTTNDSFDNLLDEPYQVEAYRDRFSDSLWQLGYNYDQSKLVGIPFETSPLVTYYRADVMDAYGFPSEPEALATFMEDPDNWLEIARTLKQDNKFIIQWQLEPLELVESTQGIFDENYAFMRNKDAFRQMIDRIKVARDEGLMSYTSIWDPPGQEDLRNNQIAMVYLGTWGAQNLKQWVPEQEDLWRATRLPFGLNGWSNSSMISVNSQSEHKEEAWKFLEYYVFKRELVNVSQTYSGSLPLRQPPGVNDYSNPFLAGQNDQILYYQLMDELKIPFTTPLDLQADKIWNDTIYQGIESNFNTDLMMSNVEKNIQKELGKEIEIIKESLDKEPN
ncbi:extracellular solute-binding protein [Aquibacillus koreensis]|uniref:Extracellular solute-binding protein n=1 Tax=Aquibacillus koreensis TaxID=279446 RepID=A0A9X3WM59_9BACI|nr:extracellular solute-binding protein [Aquibacillus koreensis]MCT2537809.1 extracellular solute-binding protein [Aquibacillus koreensis]MDC3421158.1 extracellular solute-binding protein [Aquibacillus koreensis]